MGRDSFSERLREVARTSPALPAIITESSGWSFAELDNAVSRFAAGILACGYEPGDRIAILLNNRPEYLIGLLGLARAGLVAVPLNRRVSGPEAEVIIADAGVRGLISEPDFAAIVSSVRGVDAPPSVFVLGEHGSGDGFADLIDAEPTGDDEPGCAPADSTDAPATIHYTTGTTGVPKGVVRSASANYACARAAVTAMPLSPGEGWFHTLPLHSVGVYAFALAPLMEGGHVLLQSRFDAPTAMALAKRHPVVMMHAVPTVWELLYRHAGGEPSPFPALRHAVWGAMPMSSGVARRLERWLPVPCVGCYGATEAPCITYSTPEVYRSGRFDSSGFPVDGMEIRIIDDDGCPVQDGIFGEVLVRGPILLDEYFGKPDLTASLIDPDGWFHTGDWGRCDPDGALTVTDRKKDLIITGGENVYPAEVENVISMIPGVAEVAVIGLADELWGQLVCAAVVRQDTSVTEDIVESACRARLAHFKTPRKIVFMGELPKNALGKVQKRELVEGLHESRY